MHAPKFDEQFGTRMRHHTSLALGRQIHRFLAVPRHQQMDSMRTTRTSRTETRPGTALDGPGGPRRTTTTNSNVHAATVVDKLDKKSPDGSPPPPLSCVVSPNRLGLACLVPKNFTPFFLDSPLY